MNILTTVEIYKITLDSLKDDSKQSFYLKLKILLIWNDDEEEEEQVEIMNERKKFKIHHQLLFLSFFVGLLLTNFFFVSSLWYRLHYGTEKIKKETAITN